jgi:hypothetical protein
MADAAARNVNRAAIDRIAEHSDIALALSRMREHARTCKRFFERREWESSSK